MSDSLTYADALKILGFQKSRLVKFLDAVASAGLASWAASAALSGKEAGIPLGLYEVKNDVLGFAHQIVRKVSEWRSGLSRFDRTQRLAAAHAVLIISSYFEALDELADLEQLDLSASEMAVQATGGASPDDYSELLMVLVGARLPMPEPHRLFSAIRDEIMAIYLSMAAHLANFVSGIALSDRLDETQWDMLLTAIAQAGKDAVEYYDRGFQQLAADNAEFAVWANLTQTQALGTGLATVTDLLNEMMTRLGGRPRARLIASYQAPLDGPVATGGPLPEGLVLPPLREAYINPHCRIGEVGPNDSPAADAWWEDKEERTDVAAYLAGYLCSRRAAEAPLVVLGEPGSGKSKLTEILAARLSDTDFLPVRVELRDVTAESMIREQIEQAIRSSPGDHVSWRYLLDSAPGALPIVLLDGFDELLQAAGVNRYDYLEQVRDFQRQEAAIGHPVAVIVTSRTVVADRVRFPVGSLALRLLPFDDDHVRAWLAVWHRVNAGALAARGLSPLTPETALRHRELAGQPLLLLMLAIYDATDNVLQRGIALDGAALYQNLLMDFALREVRKPRQGRRLSDEQQRKAAARELRQLAVVALAMFARGRQSIGDTLLNADLPILFPEQVGDSADGALTPAQRATGRFFFVHKSQARPGDDRTRSYEFLHVTFGEFLVAWLAVRALRDLAARRESEDAESTAAAARPDDGYLFAVLSFRCLAERAPVNGFLADLLAHLPDGERARCRELLTDLIRDSLYPHDGRSHLDYQPRKLSVPARLAAYSANLFTLLILSTGNLIDIKETLSTQHPRDTWAKYAHLWYAYLASSEWAGVLGTIRVQARPSLHLMREDGSPVSLTASIDTGLDGLDKADLVVHSTAVTGLMIREAAFLLDHPVGSLLGINGPAIESLGDEFHWVDRLGTQAKIPARVLAMLDYSRDATPERRAEWYLECAGRAGPSRSFDQQFLLRLRDDVKRLPLEAAVRIIRLSGKWIVDVDAAFVLVLNELWRRAEPEAKDAAVDIAGNIADWPPQVLGVLDSGLSEKVFGRRDASQC